MSYNKLQELNLKLENSLLNQSNLIYLKEENQSKKLKINNKFLIKDNASSKIIIEKNESNEEIVKFFGNLLTNKNVTFFQNISIDKLYIKDTNDLNDATNLFSLEKDTSTNIFKITSRAQNKNIKISSKSKILFTKDMNKTLSSKEVIGQFICNSLGEKNIVGENGIIVNVKEKNGKKYFELDNSYISQSETIPVSYKTVFSWNKIDEERSNKDNNNQYAFIQTFKETNSTTSYTTGHPDSRKFQFKATMNTSSPLWNTGKHFIYIDVGTELENRSLTTVFQNNLQSWSDAGINRHPMYSWLPVTTSRSAPHSNLVNIIGLNVNTLQQNFNAYEMIIDISDPTKTWNRGDEISFYLNLNKNSQSVSSNQKINRGFNLYSLTSTFNFESFSELINGKSTFNVTMPGFPNPLQPVYPEIQSATSNGAPKIFDGINWSTLLFPRKTIGKKDCIRYCFNFSDCPTYSATSPSQDLNFSLPPTSELLDGDIMLFYIYNRISNGSFDYSINIYTTSSGSSTNIVSLGKGTGKYQKVGIIYNSATNTWSVMSDLDHDNYFLSYDYDGIYARYQYVVKFPKNHKIFFDNNISARLSSSFLKPSVFSLKKAISVFDSTWQTTLRRNNYNIPYGSHMVKLSSQILYPSVIGSNCMIFDSSLNLSSFSLTYLGDDDPSNPGIGTWIIK